MGPMVSRDQTCVGGGVGVGVVSGVSVHVHKCTHNQHKYPRDTTRRSMHAARTPCHASGRSRYS